MSDGLNREGMESQSCMCQKGEGCAEMGRMDERLGGKPG